MIFDACTLALLMSPAGACLYCALAFWADENFRRTCEAAMSFDPVSFFRDV